MARRRGFTLIELLLVILIIALVSVVALPTVLPAINHRQVSEAGRILQGALVGARDKAIHDGRPSGIRLLPDPVFPIAWQPATINGLPNPAAGQIDPTQPLCYNRIVPIGPAPEYSEGKAMPIPTAAVAGALAHGAYAVIPNHIGFDWRNPPPLIRKYGSPGLILAGLVLDPNTGAPEAPVSWSWNVRVGDKVQINGAGPWYTVIGPVNVGPAQGNSEMFVNCGSPEDLTNADQTPAITTVVPNVVHRTDRVEYLILADGRDDNTNGWTDEGWDGIDNDGANGVDDPGEWEPEAWQGALSSAMPLSVTYTIRRRPMPSPSAREVALPTAMVIDATTAFLTQERSRLPVDRFAGTVDILVNPDGTVSFNSPYGVPSSFGLADTFYHFWLAERQDVTVPSGTTAPLLPILPPEAEHTAFTGATLKGSYALLSLSARTGQIATVESPPFYYDVQGHGYNAQVGTYSPNNPFRPSMQGLR